MKTRNILLIVLYTLLVTKLILTGCGISFTSYIAGELFFFFLTLLGLAAWLFHLRTAESRMILSASALAVYCIFFTVFKGFGNREELELASFHNTDKLISRNFDFDMLGGPHIDISIGSTYAWGFLYKEDLAIRIDGEGPPPFPETVEIPDGISDSTGCDCWFAEDYNLLFDFDTHTLYKLEKREQIQPNAI
jgi:hypothetical protein